MGGGKLIGVDLGGTQVRVGLVDDERLEGIATTRINAQGSVDELLLLIYDLIDQVGIGGVDGIGIGVPSVVDIEKGIVYDVQNIPSWKKVPLKSIFEKKYSVPIYVNNDANCFALGEKYFGKGRGFQSIIGLIIGTGFGAGIIVNNQLYAGANCGAGEFGMISYLDSIYEHYCCGQFFTLKFGQTGEQIFQQAVSGNQDAMTILSEFGHHLGNGIKTILCAYDPEIIIFGGSVRKAFAFFKESMWASIGSFVYPQSIKNLKIEISELDNIAILGAAALCYAPD